MDPVFSNDIEQCLIALQKGELILYPTDTVWGIGADATNADAVAKIYALKQREETKSMIVLLAEERQLLTYVANPDPAIFDFLPNLKEPTTIIYNTSLGLASNLTGTNGSVAIRLVKEDFCRHLLKRFKKPIVSTSANISGKPTPRTFAEIETNILNGVDYVVRYRQNDTEIRQPSAILIWHNGREPEKIR